MATTRASKVVTWHDPTATTATGLSMAGIDYLRAMVDGALPPPPPSSGMMSSAEPRSSRTLPVPSSRLHRATLLVFDL